MLFAASAGGTSNVGPRHSHQGRRSDVLRDVQSGQAYPHGYHQLRKESRRGRPKSAACHSGRSASPRSGSRGKRPKRLDDQRAPAAGATVPPQPLGVRELSALDPYDRHAIISTGALHPASRFLSILPVLMGASSPIRMCSPNGGGPRLSELPYSALAFQRTRSPWLRPKAPSR